MLSRKIIFAAFFAILSAAIADAGVMPFSFYHSRSLSMNIAGIYPNICTPVELQNLIGGKVTGDKSPIAVTFSTTGTLAFYSDSSCANPTTTATIPANWSGNWVYVMSPSLSVSTASATASGYGIKTIAAPVTANPFVWTGNGGNTTWSNGANWSGGVAPNSTQVAYFDNSCASNCIAVMTANPNVRGIVIDSSFTGTITQNNGVPLTIGMIGWKQSGGTFLGSTAGDAITLSGPFYLNGGSFRATSGTLTQNADFHWTVTGTPTFTHNNGTISWPANFTFVYITPGSVTYNNILAPYRQTNFNLNGGTMNLAGSLTILSPDCCWAQQWNNGTVNIGGDLNVQGVGTVGDATFNLNGSANQTITFTGTTARVPSLKISSTGGTVFLVGRIEVTADYAKTSGTIDAGTSELVLSTGWQARNHTFGTEVYNNVSVWAAQGDFLVSGTLRIGGTLAVYSSVAGHTWWGGSVEARGNVVVTGYGFNGDTVLKLAGSTNQDLDLSGADPAAQVPHVEIASTGGTVFLKGIINFFDSWVYTSGAVSAGTSTLSLGNSAAFNKTFTPGTPTYYNVILTANNGYDVNITTSLNAANITLSPNVNYKMPNPGGAYSINASGTLTVGTGANLYLYGATKTHGTLVNNGTITP